MRELKKSYNDIAAVKGVSFTIDRGEIFGFLGPNGAGKTTTISMLCTLLIPTGGRATVNGFDVVKNKLAVRKSIGLVFQDPSLDERLTALENLIFHAMIYGIGKADRDRRIPDVLELVELSGRQNDLVKTFSGGMKRRLEIARGLLHRPKVLFLDEPTLGLDPQTRYHIWEYVQQLIEDEGLTIFLTTHYMDEAENCDRIAIIDDGELIAMNTPEELKESIGGEVVLIVAEDNRKASLEIKDKFNIAVQEVNGELSLKVANGSHFMPELIKALETTVISISLRKPTLEDVFLDLTGRRIRDEKVEGMDQARVRMRARRGRTR
ncbi:ATP-binding cassette domain-containing protein [Candidatus Aquicultor secundus]|uniref:ATP-binding cassette domain-containing protein n=1 Tax=Candidatus Aquicultor secundus TaxID=1973895 RepID=UPI00257A771D|nr:ATP-binding cassette domain-containing protein [Candidatus Aquicultor secundus]